MSEQIGKCLCGGVRFRLAEVPSEVTVCHCGMCRQLNGGLPPANVLIAPPSFDADATLKWKQTSPWAKRGFCSECGTNLFWSPASEGEGDIWGCSAGSLENPPPLKISQHIFVDEKPDFYNFSDDAPRLTGEEWFTGLVEMIRAEKGDAVADQMVEMAKAAKAKQ